MSDLPRLLVLMGSGETSPTMVKPHRELLDRLGPPPVPAVLLDTPFGFQANADDIAGRAVAYFAESVGHPMSVASFRSDNEVGTVEHEIMLNRLREARYVFAGPGSPSYALRQWAGSQLPEILRAKLRDGGCVTFASAAALTIGVATVPVYEIYKVGAEPEWLPGLDLLAGVGLHAAVIPHFDNAEGGNHDTRFCYLGESRLARLEGELPDGAFVLGIDEHTACILDLDAGTATVAGRGVVTVRAAGRSAEITVGTTVAIAHLHVLAAGLRDGGQPVTAAPASAASTGPSPAGTPRSGAAASPFMEELAAAEAAFAAAVEEGDVRAAVTCILELEARVVAWTADTLQSDELDRGRAAVRSMIVRLGELAEAGAADPRAAVAPFVDALLQMRTAARSAQRWADSDAIRDRLVELGVEVNDGPQGTAWNLAG